MSSPVIYDWPTSIVPARQLFHAGGRAVEGGFTSGSVRILNPEPGGLSWLEMEFGYQMNADPDPLVSWLMSKVANGNVFRVPIAKSPQLVRAAALGITGAHEYSGLPWDNDQPWDGGQNWSFEPGALVTATGLEGTMTVKFSMGALSNAIRPGHVIGHKDVAYLIDDVSYSESVATATLMSPLRKDVAVDDFISFRPVGLFSALDPDAFRGKYEPADRVRPGAIRLMEAIL